MSELVLTRTDGDRRMYAFAGVGTLRLTGLTSRRGTAEAGGRRWEMARRGVWLGRIEATDAAGGGVVGEFHGHMGRGGGALRWSGRELELRREGRWRERYVLSENGRALAAIAGKSHGKRPVTVTVDDVDAIDPGLLLFASLVVRAPAADAAGAAS
jgi:hypothetical protein